MKEYIERSEAIRALRTDVMGGLNYERILSNIPASPVRPARPGVWVDTDPEKPDWSKEKYCMSYFCSICGRRAGKYKHLSYKFCPWCGAEMQNLGRQYGSINVD